MTLTDNFAALSTELLEMIMHNGAAADAARAREMIQARATSQERCYIPSQGQELKLVVQAQVTAYSAGDAAAILRRELRTHFKGPNHEMHIFPNEPRVQNLILICNPSDLKKMRSTPPREIVDADDGLDLSL